MQRHTERGSAIRSRSVHVENPGCFARAVARLALVANGVPSKTRSDDHDPPFAQRDALAACRGKRDEYVVHVPNARSATRRPSSHSCHRVAFQSASRAAGSAKNSAVAEKSRRTCGTRGQVRCTCLPAGPVMTGSQKSNSLASAPAAVPRARRMVPIFPPGPIGTSRVALPADHASTKHTTATIGVNGNLPKYESATSLSDPSIRLSQPDRQPAPQQVFRVSVARLFH